MNKRLWVLYYVLPFLLFMLSNKNNFSQTTYFEQTNGPYATGQVISLGLGSNYKIWAGIRFAGLYYSQGSNMSFRYVPSPFISPSSILIDKRGYIYASSENYNYRGVFRSTDEGNSWTNFLPSITYVKMIELDSNSNILVGTMNQGIFSSTNDGTTWDTLWVGQNYSNLYSLSVSPQGHIFISVSTSLFTFQVYRSTNNGMTWDTLAFPESVIITKFAFSPNGHIVGSFKSTNSDSSGFFISTNNGISWRRHNITNTYFDIAGFRVIYDQSSNYFMAALSISSGTYIIRSLDNGNSWTTLAKLDNWYSSGVQIISNNNGAIFVGTTQGLKHSSDGGISWIQDSDGFFAVGSSQLTLIPGGRLSVKTNSGNFRYDNYNLIWTKDTVKTGSFVISNSGDYLLSDGKVHKSTDGGVTWIPKLVPICMNYGSRITEITKLSNGYIFCCGGQWCGVHNTENALVFRSIDEGETWEVVNGATPYGPFNTITTTENDIIFVGGGGSRVRRSTDYGNSWLLCEIGLPSGLAINVIRSKPGGTIFVGTTSSGIYKSTDWGVTWFPSNFGLASLDIRSIVINHSGIVFLGTASGIFKSTDNGENWTSLNDGLLDLSILSLLCDSLGYLYVATNGTGVFRSIHSTTSVKFLQSDVPISNILLYSYPNPFNSTTTLEFYIPERSITSLKIIDNLGREVNTIISDELISGWHRYTWDASALPSGVYFLLLVTQSKIKTTKTILLR